MNTERKEYGLAALARTVPASNTYSMYRDTPCTYMLFTIVVQSFDTAQDFVIMLHNFSAILCSLHRLLYRHH